MKNAAPASATTPTEHANTTKNTRRHTRVVLATVKLMVAEFTVPPLWRATARMVWEPGASKLTCTE